MKPTLLQNNIINKAINDSGNIVVSACPGSGKTTTIQLVTNEILRKNPKANILAVSYTNTIKTTLTEKLDRRCHIFSLHQIGMALLKAGGFAPKFKFAEHLHGKQGSPDNKYKKILTDLVSQDYSLKTEGKAAFKIINDCVELINKACLELVNFGDYNELQRIADKYRLDCTGEYHNYINNAIKQGDLEYRQFGWLSFVDMIYLPIVYNCVAKPGMFIGNKNDNWIANTIDYILVDEFQDSSPILQSVLERFSKTFNCRFIFVGDESQAIFGFAAADTQSMRKAKDKFNCEELPLNESFRLPESHVDLLNEIFGTEIVSKRGTVGSIEKITQSGIFQYVEPGAMILSRTNAPLMQTFLHLLENDTPARLIKFDLREFFEDLFDKLEKKDKNIWNDLYEGIADYAFFRSQEIRQKYSIYRANEMIEELNSNLDVLLAYLRFIRPSGRKEFFSKLERMLDNNNKSNYVSLLNIHLCKGLESNTVFLLDANKFPYVRDGYSDEEIRQEQNVHFVALSRSLENLYLVENDLE